MKITQLFKDFSDSEKSVGITLIVCIIIGVGFLGASASRCPSLLLYGLLTILTCKMTQKSPS